MLIDIVPEKAHIEPITITSSDLSHIIDALKLYLAYHDNDGQTLSPSFMMPYPTFYTPEHKQYREKHISRLIAELARIKNKDFDEMVSKILD